MLHLSPDVADSMRELGRALYEILDRVGLYAPSGSWLVARLRATVGELRFARQCLEALADERAHTSFTAAEPPGRALRGLGGPGRRARRRDRAGGGGRSDRGMKRPGLRAGRCGPRQAVLRSPRPEPHPPPGRPIEDFPRPRARTGPARTSWWSQPGTGARWPSARCRSHRPAQAAAEAPVPDGHGPAAPGHAARRPPPSRAVQSYAVREARILGPGPRPPPPWPAA